MRCPDIICINSSFGDKDSRIVGALSRLLTITRAVGGQMTRDEEMINIESHTVDGNIWTNYPGILHKS